MKLNGIIVVIILILFSSCKKNQDSHERGPDCSQKPTKYITSEISNFKFKQGTYWIFIDSISLAVDTMNVLSAGSSITPYTYCENNFHEFYAFKMRPTGNNTIGDQYSLEGNRLMRNQRSEDGTDDQIYLGGAPKIDSLFIYDRYYKAVEGYLKSDLQSGGKTAYFINTDFGFIKIERYNSNNQLISRRLLKEKFIVR